MKITYWQGDDDLQNSHAPKVNDSWYWFGRRFADCPHRIWHEPDRVEWHCSRPMFHRGDHVAEYDGEDGEIWVGIAWDNPNPTRVQLPIPQWAN